MFAAITARSARPRSRPRSHCRHCGIQWALWQRPLRTTDPPGYRLPQRKTATGAAACGVPDATAPQRHPVWIRMPRDWHAATAAAAVWSYRAPPHAHPTLHDAINTTSERMLPSRTTNKKGNVQMAASAAPAECRRSQRQRPQTPRPWLRTMSRPVQVQRVHRSAHTKHVKK